MSELLDFYQKQAELNRSTIPWLCDLQTSALQDLIQQGFPGSHDENWKYTAVDNLLQQRFKRSEQGVVDLAVIKASLPANLAFFQQLIIANGQIVEHEKSLSPSPSGVIIQALAEALLHHADKIKPYLGKLLQHEHGFHALNTASWQTGVLIYLPAGVHIKEPIVLVNWQDKANQASHTRHLIVAEEGSEATIIECFFGQQDCSYLTNTVTEAHVANHAKVVHYKVQRESKAAFHIGHLAVQQAGLSQFDSHSLSLGGKLMRSDIGFQLAGAGAKCLMNGIYMPGNNQHMDHHTTVHHAVASCQSEQDYKGILTGRSRGVFNGKVVVAKDAQHTEAHQQNKNLLLSALAEIDTKPQLEIFADDVVCSHGATVGQLDEDALFYMTTRGIDRLDASRYLIHAFAAKNLRLIPSGPLSDWMANLINQQLG